MNNPADAQLTHISWENFDFLSNQLYRQVASSTWKPDVVVGLTRGGLVLGVVFSHWLQVPMIALDVSLRDHGTHEHRQDIADYLAAGKQILVVDDINDTGATIAWIRQDWQQPAASTKVKFAVLVHNISSLETVDYQAISINKSIDPAWVVFPWEK